MAMKLPDGFLLQAKIPVDARDQYKDKAALKAVGKNIIDDGHLSYCVDDSKYYKFNAKLADDKAQASATGYFEEFKPGASTDDVKDVINGLKGAVNGVASLGSDGKVPASQLPSYVDDVIDFGGILPFISMNGSEPTPEMAGLDKEYAIPANLKCVTWTKDGAKKAAFYYSYDNKYYNTPIPPALEGGKIYVDVNTDTSYRWSGTGLVAIGGGSLVIGTDTGTAFDGAKGKALEDNLANNYVTKDKVVQSIKVTGRSLTAYYLGPIIEGKASSTITLYGAQKDLAGLMTAADKGKLDKAYTNDEDVDIARTKSLKSQRQNRVLTMTGGDFEIKGDGENAGKVTFSTNAYNTTIANAIIQEWSFGADGEKKIVMADGTLADMPSGGTADSFLVEKDINDAITKAFQ